MSTIPVPIPGPQNVMSWCSTRLDPLAVNALILAHRDGLSDEALETALRTGDYVKVLTLVWAERDRAARLEWLREDRLKFHPVLPYERAMAEFKANPTLDTITRIAQPLLIMGMLRNAMDAECSHDRSIQGPCGEMEMTYKLAFAKLVEKELPSALSFSSEDRMAIFRNTLTLLQELKEELKKETPELPSPKWLEHYGMDAFLSAFGGTPSGMKPEETWNSTRLAFVERQITSVESGLRDLASTE
jgi:hypothetical protein